MGGLPNALLLIQTSLLPFHLSLKLLAVNPLFFFHLSLSSIRLFFLYNILQLLCIRSTRFLLPSICVLLLSLLALAVAPLTISFISLPCFWVLLPLFPVSFSSFAIVFPSYTSLSAFWAGMISHKLGDTDEAENSGPSSGDHWCDCCDYVILTGCRVERKVWRQTL